MLMVVIVLYNCSSSCRRCQSSRYVYPVRFRSDELWEGQNCIHFYSSPNRKALSRQTKPTTSLLCVNYAILITGEGIILNKISPSRVHDGCAKQQRTRLDDTNHSQQQLLVTLVMGAPAWLYSNEVKAKTEDHLMIYNKSP